MKNHSKMLDKRISSIIRSLVAAILFLPATCLCAVPEVDLDTLSFVEMINSVDLGDQSKFVQQFQEKKARAELIPKFDHERARREGYSVETYRNKEIIVVTIPAKFLFAPNDTVLLPKVGEILSPFKKFLRQPLDTYRVLLLMHTDNTGSELYRDQLTLKRVNAVFDWFEDQGTDTSYLFPYAMGDEWPMVPNDSQQNRNTNRRLEIYLMPGEKMLEMAKKGKIEF